MLQRSYRFSIIVLALTASLSFFFTNCTERPRVEDLSSESVGFQHSEKILSCVPCHVPDRAAPTKGFVHYNNQDCVTCHTPTRWSEHSWHFRNPAQPTCAQCHRKDQPVVARGATHYDNQDCISCHQAALTPGITFANTKTFSHLPAPNMCMNCHEKDRPTTTHGNGRDCISCHTPGGTW